jgi:endo-1,4-beta-xylanase
MTTTFRSRALGALLISATAVAGGGCSSSGGGGASPDGAGAAGAGADGGLDGAAGCGVPASFAWSSTGPILTPRSDATHNLVSIKDPSVVYFNGKWHVFTSTVDASGAYSMAYITFADWEHTADATFYYLDQTPTLRGYHAAPQIFFFAPQSKWYLVFQSGPPQYSTNEDIENPAGWTTPQNFYPAGEPAIVKTTAGATGGWLDFWVICDDANCHLFFSDDAGHWYRGDTPIASFPAGFADPVVVMSDDVNPTRLYEASNVYKLTGTDKYLAIVEGFDADSNYKRYFRSWTAAALDGGWTPLADSFAMPFASTANVTFTEQPPWTADISHGEMLRDGTDQHLTVDPCHLQYLYQGLDPASNGLPYNSLPWQLALLTKMN